ncbi:MAG: aryl-sulfate sulfotransferase [Lachnospiraceae bacterium]|nr:aryl-sulfate sulfotransferase [Lachnospiraceae bacterium]
MAAQYKNKEHLIIQQNKREAELLKQLERGNYTAENPLVQLNPYLISPLTALILFYTDTAQEIQVTVKGKNPQGDILHVFPRSRKHVLPVYGLYPDYENMVELRLSGGEITTVKIRTEPLPKEVPCPTLCKGSKEHMGDNVIFLTQTSKADALACDYNGDVRWYLTINVSFDLKRLRNGHLLTGTDRLIRLPYYVSGVYEMGVHGKIYKEFRLPGGYHHDTFEMEDGNILMLSQEPDGQTVEDWLVLVERKTGNILKTWDYKKILPYECETTYSGSGSAHDWFHNNAVWYDKKTNSITLSGRHQDAIINIDYDSGDLNWIIGDPDGWPENYVEKYFFTPVGDDFEWSYEQHGVVVCPDGDIMMFDNGHYRSKKKENYMPASQSYSRGVKYQIDQKKRTIRQIWQYGKERGADFFSPYICNVEYYGDGRYMVHSGGIAYKDGKPLEGLGSMDGGENTVLNSITCEIVNDQVVYELQVPSNAFRAEKIPFYYAGETMETGEGKLLGELSITPEVDTEIPAKDTKEMVPDHYGLSVTEEEDRILINATYQKGELAMILLWGENNEVHRYYVNTSSNNKNFEAMCVGTFIKEDPRNVDVFINKNGLQGEFFIKLLTEDVIYDTGIQVVF